MKPVSSDPMVPIPVAAPGPATLRDVMSQFATGITVLTAPGHDGHGMTANAFTSVSLEPPLVLVCVAHTARMHAAVVSAGVFGVSVLSSGQGQVARYFADRRRPRGMAQFDAVDWTPGPCTGAPLLTGALAWLECRLTRIVDGGDHSIFLGEVLASQRSGEGGALLFFNGHYQQVGPAPTATAA